MYFSQMMSIPGVMGACGMCVCWKLGSAPPWDLMQTNWQAMQKDSTDRRGCFEGEDQGCPSSDPQQEDREAEVDSQDFLHSH